MLKNAIHIAHTFGFNGKEKDDEVTGVTGSHLDYGDRMYDSRIARWFKPDKLSSDYPSYSPYNFALNNPIMLKDEDGNIVVDVNGNPVYTSKGTYKENAVENTYQLWEWRVYYSNEGNPIHVKTYIGTFRDVQKNVIDYNSTTGQIEISTVNVPERVEDIPDGSKFNCHGFAYFSEYGFKVSMGSSFYLDLINGQRNTISDVNVKTILNDDYDFITDNIESEAAQKGMIGTFVLNGVYTHSNIYNGDKTFTTKDGQVNPINTKATLNEQSKWGDFIGLYKKKQDLRINVKTKNGEYKGSINKLQKKMQKANGKN